MKCYMCNCETPDVSLTDDWQVNVKGAGKVGVCGRCYVLTVISDRLGVMHKLMEEMKDGLGKLKS